jgi:hypothetical protein
MKSLLAGVLEMMMSVVVGWEDPNEKPLPSLHPELTTPLRCCCWMSCTDRPLDVDDSDEVVLAVSAGIMIVVEWLAVAAVVAFEQPPVDSWEDEDGHNPVDDVADAADVVDTAEDTVDGCRCCYCVEVALVVGSLCAMNDVAC